MEQHRDRRPAPPRMWEYQIEDGWTVWAGRSSADNDRLSLKLAHPNDWWFHARGMPGSHVLLRAQKGREPGKSALEAAAAIAAWHSKARNGGIVAVSMTQARHVSKPAGAKPGTVTIRKEALIRVRPALPAGQDQRGQEDDSTWN